MKLIVIMARPIKLFHLTQKLYQTIGIHPINDWHSSQLNKNQPFNFKNVLFIFAPLQFGVTTTVFFLFEAKTLDEFGISFYATLSVISIAFCYVSIFYQIGNLLKMFDNSNEFIGNSKLKILFSHVCLAIGQAISNL